MGRYAGLNHKEFVMGGLYLGGKLVTPVIEKEVAKTKFGASIDTFLGDVNSNGELSAPTGAVVLDFTGVKKINNGAVGFAFRDNETIIGLYAPTLTEIAPKGLYEAFYGCNHLESIDLSLLETLGINGLYQAFYNCTAITSVDLSSLQSVGNYGLYYAFAYTKFTNLNLSSITSVGQYGLAGVLRENKNIVSVDLSSLLYTDSNGLYYAFYNCTNLESVDLSSLETATASSLNQAFNNCGKITSISLSSLKTVQTNGLNYAFYGCANLNTVNLSKLETVERNGMAYAFRQVPSLATLSFPALTNIDGAGFGTSTTNYAFYNCTALTEIHFRADMQAKIEAMTGYDTKWGATNASIIFDL